MKKDLERYFDDPTTPLQDKDSIELAALMEEVAELESPDPGSDYWNSFNSNLQSKLDLEKHPKKSSWFRLMVPLAALAVLTAIVFVVFPIDRAVNQDLDQFSTLETLSEEDLSLLSYVHPYNSYELQSYDQMVEELDIELIDDLYRNPDDLYQNLDSIDQQMLENLFNEEG